MNEPRTAATPKSEPVRCRCNDCGTPNFISTDPVRHDVCDDCMTLRGQLIQAVKRGSVSVDEFKEVQRAMSGRSFRGAAAMRQALGLDIEI